MFNLINLHYIRNKNYNKEKLSKEQPTGIVPKTQAAFPLCIVMLSLWNKKLAERLSCVVLVSRRPSSDMNLAASSPKAPKVSIAIGTKSIEVGSWAYLVVFSVSASEATTPGPRTARLIWLGARVSGQGKSQAKHRPSDHGIVETPSGLLLSPWTKLCGSSLDGTSAADKAVLMRPLIDRWKWSRGCHGGST